MYSIKQRVVEYISYVQYVKWVYKDVVFSLEYNYEVESIRNFQRYIIRKVFLINWVD